MTECFSLKTRQIKRQWNPQVEYWNWKNSQPRILYAVKISLKNEGKIRIFFSDIQKLEKKFFASRYTLQEMLTEVPQIEGNDTTQKHGATQRNEGHQKMTNAWVSKQDLHIKNSTKRLQTQMFKILKEVKDGCNIWNRNNYKRRIHTDEERITDLENRSEEHLLKHRQRDEREGKKSNFNKNSGIKWQKDTFQTRWLRVFQT